MSQMFTELYTFVLFYVLQNLIKLGCHLWYETVCVCVHFSAKELNVLGSARIELLLLKSSSLR